VSSPTLRKLCLPCITARNHHHPRQQLNKNKTTKNNQPQIVIPSTAVIAAENNVVESLHRVDVAPRTHDPISIIPVVHSSDYLRENDTNHSHEHEHFESSFQKEKIEKNDDKTSVKAEITPTRRVSESVLLSSSSSAGNEITRSNEDDAVGICIDAGSINFRVVIEMIMSFSSSFLFLFSHLFFFLLLV
jgi:hypothetical protein